MNVREAFEDLIYELIGSKLFDAGLLELVEIELLEPETDEVFRFEVLMDDGEDLLLVATGEVNYNFDLILNIR